MGQHQLLRLYVPEKLCRHLGRTVNVIRALGVAACMDTDDQAKLGCIVHHPLAADIIEPDLLIVGMELDALHPHRFDLS